MKNSSRIPGPRQPQKGKAWAKLTDEQKAERVRKMLAKRKASEESRARFRVEMNAAIAKQKYEAFLKHPVWMTHLNPEYIDKVVDMLSEIFDMYYTQAKGNNEEYYHYLNLTNKMEEEADYDVTGSENYIRIRRNRQAAAHRQAEAALRMNYAYMLKTALLDYRNSLGTGNKSTMLSKLLLSSRDN